MAGNTFGDLFKVTTFGESHGAAIGCIIDGIPPGIEISSEDIQKDLDRRKPGQSEVTTQRNESDTVEILSGIFEGKTTGTPMGLMIRNADHRSEDYSNMKDIFRPGHADYTYFKKYGIRDYRGGGRSSGRETAARVAAGAVAKRILADYGIHISAYTLMIAGIQAETIDLDVIEQNIVRTPDLNAAQAMVKRINEAKETGDSVGGIVEVMITGCPAGLGDPVFDKLEALLSHAVMSIGAVKGIEFGSGFAAASMCGSQHNDIICVSDGTVGTENNFAGGIAGGVSNGEPIIFRCAVKPTSSITQKQQAANTEMSLTDLEIKGRHDPCLCPRIVPVVEAMTAITLADRILAQKTINP